MTSLTNLHTSMNCSPIFLHQEDATISFLTLVYPYSFLILTGLAFPIYLLGLQYHNAPSPQRGIENAVSSTKQDQHSIKAQILFLRQVREDLKKNNTPSCRQFYTTGLSSDNLYENQYIAPVLESCPFQIHAEVQKKLCTKQGKRLNIAAVALQAKVLTFLKITCTGLSVTRPRGDSCIQAVTKLECGLHFPIESKH